MAVHWSEKEWGVVEQEVEKLSLLSSMKVQMKSLLRTIINAGSPEYGDKNHTPAHFGNAMNLIKLFQGGDIDLRYIESVASAARKKIAGI